MNVPILKVWNEETKQYEGVPAIRGDKPVKGVDYWTDADKQEMVADVIAALPVYEGGVETIE